MARPRLQVVGRKFGRLTVIKDIPAGKQSFVMCQCDCGTKIKVLKTNLTRGNTKSCGCLRKDMTGQRFLGSKTNNRPAKVVDKPDIDNDLDVEF